MSPFKSALITGITGQDGAYLSRLLLDKDYHVTGLVRSLSGANFERMKYLGIRKQIQVEECDLTDLSQVIKVLSRIRPTEIYNLAAQSSVGLSFQQPIGTIQFNINSVVNILEAIRLLDLKSKFYQASSSEMFGTIDQLPITEDSKLHPLSPYAISKVAAHYITINYRESYNLFACSGILFNHESYLRGENFFVKKVIRAAMNIARGKQDYMEVGNLNIKRDFGWSEKYVEAMWLMLQHERPDDYVIASGKSVWLKDIAYYVFDKFQLDYSKIKINQDFFRPTDIEDIYGSSEKARKKLNWHYDMDFFSVLDELIAEEERIMLAKEYKPTVTFFHRKPRGVGNYSVEFIFEDVRKRLNGNIDSRVAYSKYESSGLFKRIYNCIEAAFRQSEVNHVTGDINYLGLFLRKKNTIQTILDCVHLESSSGLKYKILKLFWLTIPARRSRFLTAISESTKKEILKHVNCEPAKIKVIYVAISDKFKKKEKAFNEKMPRILQVGAAHNKNIPRLAEALEGIPCILEIIGKKQDQYESMLQARKIQYEYRSGLSDEEMIRRYEEADIIALASTYEGFGMPILEGQAVGRPVITSNVFSMPEVADDAACIVDPFDVQSIRQGILKIINDQEYRKSLIEKGFENVKRFQAEAIALEYLELYKYVANKS